MSRIKKLRKNAENYRNTADLTKTDIENMKRNHLTKSELLYLKQKPYDDEISFTLEDTEKLADIRDTYDLNEYSRTIIEAYLNNRLPLTDFSFVVRNEDNETIKARLIISDEAIPEHFKKVFKLANKNTILKGILIDETVDGNFTIFPITIINTIDDKKMAFGEIQTIDKIEKILKGYNKNQDKIEFCMDIIFRQMNCIQFLLLNPVINKVYKQIGYKPLNEKSDNINEVKVFINPKRQLEIIRRKTIQGSDIIKLASMTKRTFERHTDYWYVIGHYRNLKSGKTIWINGFWKGTKSKDYNAKKEKSITPNPHQIRERVLN